MTVIKLTIQYDGTNYIGWQRQPRGQGVSQFAFGFWEWGLSLGKSR